MIKLRYILAYILGILAWILGIAIGAIWSFLYGGYQDSNVIDIPTILMENVTPALVSVFLGNYVFLKILPNTDSRKINIIIFYSILFLNYGVILSETIIYSNHTNLIYILTGVVSLIYLIYRLNNDDNKK